MLSSILGPTLAQLKIPCTYESLVRKPTFRSKGKAGDLSFQSEGPPR